MSTNKDAWQHILIPPEKSIISAIEKMDKESLQILLVVDLNHILLGVITDGDIRRHILKHGNLDEAVSVIMNAKPKTAFLNENRDQLLQKMQSAHILHLPIVNDENKIIGLETLNHLSEKNKYDHWVIFMAGGVGTLLPPPPFDMPQPPLKKFIKTTFLQFFFKFFF